ncbi:hypothetical protein COCMIDRAFT_26340 [Bipolaris oryzae ATCC 44560]|uniref:Uncharacterized protein n=1 Tax=Bipolaris oryzae ATCC 44560 TaxID=930090 RepID=W6ZPG8_COCMI|nr:uncharacterized protein COCMIDRAFT_26340 [Bipolaris oryzae ATCC 44560]EUC45511.1 hypothetical protein COCMIDRAFT_26340 [Bipolaris oryzae ATCC 44560]
MSMSMGMGMGMGMDAHVHGSPTRLYPAPAEAMAFCGLTTGRVGHVPTGSAAQHRPTHDPTCPLYTLQCSTLQTPRLALVLLQVCCPQTNAYAATHSMQRPAKACGEAEYTHTTHTRDNDTYLPHQPRPAPEELREPSLTSPATSASLAGTLQSTHRMASRPGWRDARRNRIDETSPAERPTLMPLLLHPHSCRGDCSTPLIQLRCSTTAPGLRRGRGRDERNDS